MFDTVWKRGGGEVGREREREMILYIHTYSARVHIHIVLNADRLRVHTCTYTG